MDRYEVATINESHLFCCAGEELGRRACKTGCLLIGCTCCMSEMTSSASACGRVSELAQLSEPCKPLIECHMVGLRTTQNIHLPDESVNSNANANANQFRLSRAVDVHAIHVAISFVSFFAHSLFFALLPRVFYK